MKPRILLMEDQPDYRATLAMNLKLEGYSVFEVGTGREALELFENQHFDLCILDVMVPGINGLEVCERIRIQAEKIPLLFISAMTMTEDRLNGLRRGADDYVVKPFHLEELLIKIDRLLRKGFWIEEHPSPSSAENEIHYFGDNFVNFQSYEAKGIQGIFSMTKKEADLMRLFIDHPNEVLTRERILHSVWGYNVFTNSRSIDNFVLFLRQKFESDPKNPIYFRGVRGAGYRFTPKGA
ncbi:MAG: response regulator transcription factor [Bacteroidota bacterium]|nr:response regulator transcription factor [Bacteroidota bacterium]MDX5430631.1 response regulator transcription factor [Bacteroidota bacterium]MDX5469381.1 response regulator transcription factor [Bacteroidota bacterium]